MNKKLQLILSELQTHLERLYGPRLNRLVLYGSQARGEATPGSDIDVLVVLDGPVQRTREDERTSEIVAGLSLKYDEVISCFIVSTERFENEQSSLLINIRQEGITDWSSLQPVTDAWQKKTDIRETQSRYRAAVETDSTLYRIEISNINEDGIEGDKTLNEVGLGEQLAFVVTQRQQDEATILAQAVREGLRALYHEALIEAYLLGQINREMILKELGPEQVDEIEYQRDILQRDIEWGLKGG